MENSQGEKTVRITADLLQAGRSSRGAWTKAQLALLGVTWPPQRGWRRLAIGRKIPEVDAREFVELRDCHILGANRQP